MSIYTFRCLLIGGIILCMWFVIAYLFAYDNSPYRWDALAGANTSKRVSRKGHAR